MRSFIFKSLAAAALAASLLGLGTSLRAETSVAKVILGVGSGVQGSADVGLQPKADGTHVPVSSITWNTQDVGAGWVKCPRYIELSLACNYGLWRLDIYTNNTGANTGYLKGGLLGISDNTQRVPVAWLVSDSTESVTSVGTPWITTHTVTAGTTTATAPWRPVKDKNDTDDPATVDDPGTPDVVENNESWAWAYANGITTVLYGGSTFAHTPDSDKNATTPYFIYLEGDFSSPSENTAYGTTLWVDLFYE